MHEEQETALAFAQAVSDVRLGNYGILDRVRLDALLAGERICIDDASLSSLVSYTVHCNTWVTPASCACDTDTGGRSADREGEAREAHKEKHANR